MFNFCEDLSGTSRGKWGVVAVCRSVPSLKDAVYTFVFRSLDVAKRNQGF